MSDFSIKDYLIDNKLANKKGELIASDNIPTNAAWGLGPYVSWDAMIHLTTLIHFFNEKDMLNNLVFLLKESNEFYYTIFYI
jgi:hypothetical protein